ncbi:MAG: anthranilate synthase component I family protein [Phycisphaerae bacterium]
MPSVLPIDVLPARPGPAPLDLLHAVSSGPLPAGECTLLHSATNAAFSVLARHPFATVEVDAAGVPHFHQALPSGLSPLDALQHVIEQYDFTAPHPLIGWLGFLSYDLAHSLESIGQAPRDNVFSWPLLRFSLYQHYLLYDHSTGQWTPICLAGSPSQLQKFCDDHFNTVPPGNSPPIAAAVLQETSRHDYIRKIRRTQEYIAAGDIYQANIAQRWILETRDTPHAIYRRLCQYSPADFAAYLQFTGTDGQPRHALSASPELFLLVDNGRAATRPIKGTRPRDPADPARDEQLRSELLGSEKDKAELAMIVDLLRNDLGRVSRFGSVEVTVPRQIEQHPTVWHTVAMIQSTLRPDATLADLLRALLPGGSITGAPKIRACQVINELEAFPRTLYCGNIGIIGPRARSLALNIAIRTILMTGRRAHVYAGAGIVADSTPEQEYEETLHKAAAMLRALGMKSQ